MGAASAVHLHNISPHGCLLQTAEAFLAPGRAVRVKIAGLSTLDGKVVWAEGSSAGVEFAVALHPAVVEYIAGKMEAQAARSVCQAPTAAGSAG
jgi:hypothetical protein